jgi:hypothetical protein
LITDARQQSASVSAGAAISALLCTGMTASAQTAPAQTGPTPTDTTLTATSTPPAAAPTTPTPQAAATPNPIKAGDWTISIWNRTRVESWDYFQGIAGPAGNAGDGEYSFVGNLLRVGALNANPKRDIQLEISQPTLLGLPRTATAFGPGTAGQGGLGLGANYYAANLQRNDYSVFLKQAFVRLKSLIGAPGNSLRLGRFEFIDGLETTPKDPTLGWLKRERIAHRLIGNFGFSHVQRSFDGGQVVFNNSSSNITLAALRPTAGVFDVDANGNIGGVSVLYGAWTKPAATSDTRIFTSYYQRQPRRYGESRQPPAAGSRRRHRCHWRHDAGPTPSAHIRYGQQQS